ncbi:MAG: thiamine pyrophosphate-dependent enzyme [Rhodobacteraceae bacterium]|nr:thiamine pyrophosphate-dependent enzyme [Paracoccaceae bacterium]MCY4137935.1 thiamine pyrophosphate-dependent enzyme [Paracoccaceae bacterium]
MRTNTASRIRDLEIIAARIRRNVLEICRQRGGYAAQGVALADIAACLYFDEMRPNGNGWFHDRFVLSNGHDAIMTYGALAEHGTYTMDELKTYNADGTRIDQSPIEGQLGFEITAGSLGQGPSQAAGIAWAERKRGSDKRIYCLFSDGELQEGNVWEAAMFAGHQKLSNLVYIVDNNDMQASGHASDVLGVEPVPEKFEAFGFAAHRINGTSTREILDAFEEARNTTDKPYVMVCDTRLFDGIDCLQEALPMAHYVSRTGADWDAGIAEITARIDILTGGFD